MSNPEIEAITKELETAKLRSTVALQTYLEATQIEARLLAYKGVIETKDAIHKSILDQIDPHAHQSKITAQAPRVADYNPMTRGVVQKRGTQVGQIQ